MKVLASTSLLVWALEDGGKGFLLQGQSFRKGLLSPLKVSSTCKALWGYKGEKLVASLSSSFLRRKSLKE